MKIKKVRIVPRGVKAVEAIIKDLKDRKGIGDEWDSIDADIQKEMKERWAELVREAHEYKPPKEIIGDLNPDDYRGPGGKIPPELDTLSSRGWTSIEVLEFLKGRPWDRVALAFCLSLRPSKIRVSSGVFHLDSVTDRISVLIDDSNNIQRITMEVTVWLPDGVANGSALNLAAKYGIDSDVVKWYDDPDIDSFVIAGGYFKRLRDGTLVPFPGQEAQEPTLTLRVKE